MLNDAKLPRLDCFGCSFLTGRELNNNQEEAIIADTRDRQ